MTETQFEVLIIGGGLAGMSLALRLAESGRNVGLVAKGPLTDSSSNWAQGGIAAAIGPQDSAERIISVSSLRVGRTREPSSSIFRRISKANFTSSSTRADPSSSTRSWEPWW